MLQQGFDPTNQSLTGLAIGSLTIGLLGVLMITGEYGSGTIRSSLAAIPRRPLFLGGQGARDRRRFPGCGRDSDLCLFFHRSGHPLGECAGRLPRGTGVLRALLLSGAYLALLGMFGLGLGVIIRHTAGAITAFVGVIFLLPVLLQPLNRTATRSLHPVQMLANRSPPSCTSRSSRRRPSGLPSWASTARSPSGWAMLLLTAGRMTRANVQTIRGVRVRELVKEMADSRPEKTGDRSKELARIIWHEPFAKRTWSELLFLMIGVPLAALGHGLRRLTWSAGVVLAITFFGLAIIALSVRGARGLGGIQRRLARGCSARTSTTPNRSSPPGLLGLAPVGPPGPHRLAGHGLRGREGPVGLPRPLRRLQRVVGRLRLPHLPVLGRREQRARRVRPAPVFFRPGFFVSGQVRLLARARHLPAPASSSSSPPPGPCGPWSYLDRRLMRVLLAPDAVAVRVRSLEQARAQTVDSSAATLRRIERDLHDGTQAQLVALAMRLGMAKEKLADDDHLDLDQVRQLVNDAHRGAKEAIVELRDLARGIHPPALDVGLEGALSTLAARSTVPTELTLALSDRPTPAIEAIAYFCVAELLANVAQHAQASRASITCAQHGAWLRVVVRDDGVGGARSSALGSSSSGLAGLTDRVHAVDGRLEHREPAARGRRWSPWTCRCTPR